MTFTGRDGHSELSVKADKVVYALGQEALDAFSGIDPVKGVFAGGDYVTGGKTVVEAVAQGKAAAESICRYLA